jgi:hypothetical protein
VTISAEGRSRAFRHCPPTDYPSLRPGVSNGIARIRD